MAASSNGTPLAAEPPPAESSPLPLCSGLDSHSKDCHARARRWLLSRVVPPPVAVPLEKTDGNKIVTRTRPRFHSPKQGGLFGRCCVVSAGRRPTEEELGDQRARYLVSPFPTQNKTVNNGIVEQRDCPTTGLSCNETVVVGTGSGYRRRCCTRGCVFFEG